MITSETQWLKLLFFKGNVQEKITDLERYRLAIKCGTLVG